MIYEGEEYVIRPINASVRAVKVKGIHRMFIDLADVYIYEVEEKEKEYTIEEASKYRTERDRIQLQS